MTRSLKAIAARLREKIVRLAKLSDKLVELDIAARTIEKEIAHDWVKSRATIIRELNDIGMTEAEWCKRELGCSIQTMRRRVQLLKGWDRYLKRRREVGDNGQFGLLYATYLSAPDMQGHATDAKRTSIRYDRTSETLRSCQFIAGDARVELPKLTAQSVNVIVCSPPYWPSKRVYGGRRELGFEQTLDGYISNLVAIFREARRVLRDDGILWIVIDDAYMHRRTLYGQPPHEGRRSKLPLAEQIGLNAQTKDEASLFGNLLFVPERLAIALQEDGWMCRAEIIWDKGAGGRKEPVNNRPRRNFEKVLMLTKNVRYKFDLDPIRESVKSRFYATVAGREKPGVIRMDSRRGLGAPNNPLGRNPGSVWHIPPANYHGKHSATFPPELVRRLLLISCPDKGVVLALQL